MTRRRWITRPEAHVGLKTVVHGTRHRLQSLGEDVIQEPHEDAGIISRQLAKIEVTEGTE